MEIDPPNSVNPTYNKPFSTISLYFSEAVQSSLTDHNFNITDANSLDLSMVVATTISSNKVSVSFPWTAGSKYHMNMGFDAFMDLTGNTLESTTSANVLALEAYVFTMSSDVAAPEESTTTTASPNEVPS